MGQLLDEDVYPTNKVTMFDLIVKEKGTDKESWVEKDYVIPDDWEGSVEEFGSEVINTFNSTLKKGEEVREFVGVMNVRQVELKDEVINEEEE